MSTCPTRTVCLALLAAALVFSVAAGSALVAGTGARSAAAGPAPGDASSATRVAPAARGGSSAGSPRRPEILVTRQLAAAHGLRVGDVVSLGPGANGAGSREFRIAGTYEPTPDPMRLTAKRHEARLHLPDLIALAGDRADPASSETVQGINIALHDPAEAGELARELSARWPDVAAFATAQDGAATPFVALERFHTAIAIVTVIGSSAFLLALMVMRAEERRETVGILRLIGFSKRRILLEVLLEGLAIAFSGAIFGVLVAVVTEGAINAIFQRYYDTALIFLRVTAPIAWKCIALAVPLGVLAGLAASWTLLRRDIVALLRR